MFHAHAPPDFGMASPKSRYTERPQKVSTPPMIHRKSETPTEPVAAKIPDGVEKMPVPIILFKMRKTELVTPSLRESSNA